MSQDLANEELVHVNGVNASTGEYLEQPWSLDDVVEVALAEEHDSREVGVLQRKVDQGEANFRVVFGVDERDLTQAGWGVIFAKGADPAIKEALKELFDYRENQASPLYKEYEDDDGYLQGESWEDFRRRHKIGSGAANPEQMPYYVLIVGDPETIPYSFQYQLDVERAVGRIYFDTLDEYERYAHSVVGAETDQVRLPRRAVFFGTHNNDDKATRSSAEYLVKPLAATITQKLAERWTIESVPPEEAMKARLAQLLGGVNTPALLFTASHGAGFNRGDHQYQLERQGALVCGDWPGPLEWRGPLSEEWYFHAGDVGADARVWGLIAVLFACYSAGTPRLNDFVHRRDQGIHERLDIAPKAFVAPLPRRLLSHPNGGALAVVGHVDRAWDTSFLIPGVPGEKARDLSAFESMLRALMLGWPLGYALEGVNSRYADLGTSLSDELYRIRQHNLIPDKPKLARLWTANNDARNYVIIGDPAVRLPVQR